jgi:protein-S-isoprenylcysteine O-methyltransferase Ste14
MNLYFIIYILWGLSEVLLNRFVRSGSSDKKGADNHTELVLWIAVILSLTFSVFIAMRFSFPLFVNPQLSILGIIMIVLGIILRFIAIKQLGKFFTVDVTIRKDHELVQHGLYKYMRHPSYTGLLITFLGFGISLNNWISVIVVFFPVLITTLLRINLEEKVLTEQFGQEYKDYAGKTKRLIPFVY